MKKRKEMCLYRIVDPPYLSIGIVDSKDENGDCFVETTIGTIRRVHPLYVGPVDPNILFEFGLEVVNYIKESRSIQTKFLDKCYSLFGIETEKYKGEM